MHATVRASSAGLLIAAVVAGTAACTTAAPAAEPLPSDVGPPSDTPFVEVQDNRFVPERLVVAAGTTVEWEWVGRASHDVVGSGFESEIRATGTFTHTFESTGSYPYVCTLHPGMEGTVDVVPAEDT